MLPLIHSDNYFPTEIHKLCQLVRRELSAGFELTFLRSECEEISPDRLGFNTTLLVFQVASTDSPEVVPDGYQWVSQLSVTRIKVQPPTPSVLRYLEDYNTHGLYVHAHRLFPYSLPGWFDKATNWIRCQLTRAGQNVKSILQMKQNTQGCVLRADTDTGLTFFMKALPNEELCDEAVVTSKLGDLMPERFFSPVAIDLDNKWMLMRDYGKTLSWGSCRFDVNPTLMKKVLREWGAIQKESISLNDKLVKAAMPVRDTAWLKEKTKEMLADPDWFQQHSGQMSTENRERYKDHADYRQKYLEHLERLSRRATEYKVPLTLVHGDLNADNTIIGEKGDCQFIDFGCTCVSFPFRDALSLALICGAENQDLIFYLEQWTEYETTERLWELLELMGNIEDAFSTVLLYHLYRNAEESGRCETRTEVGLPVWSEF